jgi:hypothetical protein
MPRQRTLRATALCAGLAISLLAASSAHALCAAARDMNGIWKANDGGTYHVRQIGNEVWWVGMSGDGGKGWTNVYKGTRNGNVVTGNWADVPKGRARSGGVMNLAIQGSTGVASFSRTQVSGGFGGSRWSQSCDDVVLNPVP